MNDGSADRERLARFLGDALEALERGDEHAWRQRIQALADTRTRNLVKRLGRLARELDQALEALPPGPFGGRLDDAGARLDHVVAMTEQATHRTLDLIEEGRAMLVRLEDSGLDAPQAEIAGALRNQLKEMALAQSHQDLGGQIIRRVAGIVRSVHENLSALDLPQGGVEAPSPAGHGPAVEGLDRDRIDQRDADDLLSRLGL